MWDTETGTVIASIPVESPIYHFAFSPDWTSFTTLGRDGKLRIYEAGRGR